MGFFLCKCFSKTLYWWLFHEYRGLQTHTYSCIRYKYPFTFPYLGGYSTSIGFLKPLSLQQAGAIDSEDAAIDSEDAAIASEDAAIDSEDAAIACFRDVIVK